MADLATLQTRLAEAEAALHRLLTGAQAVEVNDGRRSVRYGSDSGSVDALRVHVAQLKSEIAFITGEGRRRAVGVKF